jgi:hypothetical protein
LYDFEIDGRLQVTAGAALLECSRLVDWHTDPPEFQAVPREIFEYSWRRDVDPAFGRLICWVNFSAGAEMLAKGVCLLHEIEIRYPRTVPTYPTAALDTWSAAYAKSRTSGGTIPATNYGTLRNLVDLPYPKINLPPALPRLFEAIDAKPSDRALLLAAYGLLATTIRNRDAHAYVPNVRDSHFHLVNTLFEKCLNLLVSWLPGGAEILTVWKRDAGQFNASL